MKNKLTNNIEVTHNSRNVCTVYCSGISAGWELNVLARADAHHDNAYCDRNLEKEHLAEAKGMNAMIFDVGDLFCAMQGKFDPRKTYSELRPEYKVDNYLDEIVADAARFYGPYASNFIMLSPGNHESSILKNNGVDLTNNLVYALNTQYGGHIQRGGYGGYIRFMFNSGKNHTRVIKYFHGTSPTVSTATINKQATIYPDADIIINGHSHVTWYQAIARETLSERGVVSKSLQHHIRTASYKDAYKDGFGGWEVENGHTPKPVGAVWIKFVFKNNNIEIEIRQAVR